jgi:cold shock CspA family protein
MDDGTEVFFHHSEAVEAISTGAIVSFELVNGKKGPKAKNVSRNFEAEREREEKKAEQKRIEQERTARSEEERKKRMKTGTVKFYNVNEEYGFITMAWGTDVYFRRSGLMGKTPSRGDKVSFELINTSRGSEAKRVAIQSTGCCMPLLAIIILMIVFASL